MSAPQGITSMAVVPYQDGTALLKLDDTEYILDNLQVNTVLTGLLRNATIEIRPRTTAVDR